jgi:hypothetical protein
METKGVSSWVSVQFKDVEKFVPELTTGVPSEPEDAAAEGTPAVVAVAEESEPEYVLEPAPSARVAAAEEAPHIVAVPEAVEESAEGV